MLPNSLFQEYVKNSDEAKRAAKLKREKKEQF